MSDEGRSPARFYRRSPGPAWLVALVAIPLLLAAIGWAGLKSSSGQLDAEPTVSPSATLTAPEPPDVNPPPPEMDFAPLSIARTVNGFTLDGELPTLDAKTSLSQSLRLAFGSGIALVDRITVKPGGNAPDFAALGSILAAAVDITDFSFQLKGDTVTLGGTTSTGQAKSEVASAVTAAWPKMKVVNNITVK